MMNIHEELIIILQTFMDHQQKNQKEMDKVMDSNDWLEGEDEKGDRLTQMQRSDIWIGLRSQKSKK